MPLAWPRIEAADVQADTAELALAQAEAHLAAQIEGLDRLQARLGTLLTLCVTLGSAALSVGAAVLGLIGKVEGVAARTPWMFAPPLLVAGGVWLAGAYTAATAIRGVAVASPGKDPRTLYDRAFLGAARTELVLYMIRVVGEAVAANERPVDELARALETTLARLRLAPVWGAGVALVAAVLAAAR